MQNVKKLKKCFSTKIHEFCVIFHIFSVVNGRNASGPSHGKFVVCSALAEPLFPIDLIYSFFGLSQFDKLNLDLCTHLIYIDLALSEHKDAFDTEVLHRSDYNRIELLRQKHPHLKVI